MQFSLVKETATCENRVALTPSGVGQLIAAGHEVFVQTDAGFASHFADREYQEAGAVIVYTPEEAYARGDVVVKVLPPRKEEVEYLTEDRALLCFLQLAAGRENLLQKMLYSISGFTTVLHLFVNSSPPQLWYVWFMIDLKFFHIYFTCHFHILF